MSKPSSDCWFQMLSADWVSAFFAGVAVIASLYVAVASTGVTKSNFGISIYTEFLRTCIEHPNLALAKPVVSDEDMAKYRWFLGNMCLSLEILILNTRDDAWKTTATNHLVRHKAGLIDLATRETDYFAQFSKEFKSLLNSSGISVASPVGTGK